MKVLQKTIFIALLAAFFILMIFNILRIQKNAGFQFSNPTSKPISGNLESMNKIKAPPQTNHAPLKGDTGKNTQAGSSAPNVSTKSGATTSTAQQGGTSAGLQNGSGKSDFPQRTVFIGDSITEGLSSYCLVDDEKVFASKGLTLTKAKSKIPDVAKTNPKRIFILLGTNDLLYGMKSSEYIKSYEELINLIRKYLPKVDIYIESILPVTDEVQNKRPLLLNSRIDEFNNALVQMSKEEGVNYVKAAVLFKNSKGYMDVKYSSDGIHLKFEAYKTLLNCLKSNAK